MKIVKKAGKAYLKMTKAEWVAIGQQMGMMGGGGMGADTGADPFADTAGDTAGTPDGLGADLGGGDDLPGADTGGDSMSEIKSLVDQLKQKIDALHGGDLGDGATGDVGGDELGGDLGGADAGIGNNPGGAEGATNQPL